MRFVRLLPAVVLCFALVACGSDTPDHGTILGKSFTPAHTDWIWQCYSYNQQGMCTYQAMVPIEYSDEYFFDLKDGDHEGWRDVSHAEYDYYKVGDYYPQR